ncbi:MAG: hypothetical protein DSM106950_33680 [Stigonema ocellatum SAG 48.90 = DSM 106950]|nr:hypothetical protein [Stigonema ocellatum SAG 48.90 = DSM 106950]
MTRILPSEVRSLMKVTTPSAPKSCAAAARSYRTLTVRVFLDVRLVRGKYITHGENDKAEP